MPEISITAAASALRRRHAEALLSSVLVFVAVAAARCIYVSLCGASIPFWDQWDELNQQLRPLLDGTWHLASLFAAHNEHRILFTRLISIGLFATNGEVFDNLVECYVNALVYAGLWTLIYALLIRGSSGKTRGRLLLVAVIALGLLPFDWENTVVGFQNQFYLMELVAVALIGIAAYRSLSRSTVFILTLLATASLFTMAAGVLAAPVVCAVLLLKQLRERLRPGLVLAVIIAMMGITAFGLAILPDGAASTLFNARGAREHIRALLIALMWPMQPSPPIFSIKYTQVLFATMVWAPTALCTWRLFRNRRAEPNEIFAIGMAIWTLLQFLAIAHARGHGMTALTWRYTEIPAIGLACNFWLALSLQGSLRGAHRIALVAPVILGAALVGCIFWQRTPADYGALKQRSRFSAIETWHIQHYLSGQPLPESPQSPESLPYPSSTKLQRFLDMPSMKALLPASAYARDPHSPLSILALALQKAVLNVLDAGDAWSIGAFGAGNFTSRSDDSSARCALDGISADAAATNAAHASGLVQLNGWIADSKGEVPRRFTVILANSHQAYSATGLTGILRPDVARALHSESARSAGYSVVNTLNSVSPGAYRVILSTGSGGIKGESCDTRKTLLVLP